ncbi:MAG: signal peptidase [Thermoguttaceae bacterium]|nr:signal peptidase [Thermoguttaceae bacterium]MDW8078389.1 regulatory iron-sulfur-containing complex subunit RicT [Thermoguttaceae bacterium]
MPSVNENEVVEKPTQRQPQDYIVRFGAMRHLGVFTWNKPEPLARWTEVIVRTDRGTEIGVVLRRAESAAFEALGDAKPSARGSILRVMTEADRAEARRIAEREKAELATCARYVAAGNLPMKLVRVEHLFGGERIIVYFRAAERVDFRQLVRQLAREFRTRIEMRQIGVRDEARLLADYGDCGHPVCCNTHLVIIPPISMHMAKVQRSTLDPTKISGRCGRLKCCLRYEYETYQSLLQQCPPIGAEVRCSEGQGRVVGQELLKEQVWVEIEGRGRKLVPIAGIEVLALPEEAEELEVAAQEEAEESIEVESGDFANGPQPPEGSWTEALPETPEMED